MPKQRKITFLSLFSGCGGFDLGFRDAGFKCLGAFDADPVAVDTYNANHRPMKGVALDLSGWSSALSPFVGKPDVVIAGPPCQGFSVAGKRKLNDPRNHLLLRATEIAVRLRPAVFVLENVMATRSGRHKRYWHQAIEHLRKNGYGSVELTLNCSQLGVPQMRKRAVLIASRSGAHPEIRLSVSAPRTLRDGLRGLRGDKSHQPKAIPAGSRMHQIVTNIEAGQQLSNARNGIRSVHTWDIPSVFGKVANREKSILEAMLLLRRRMKKRRLGDADPLSPECIAKFIGRPVRAELKTLIAKNYVRKVGNHFDLRNTFNGKFRRLSWDKPSYTVDTRFADPRNFLHPNEHRGFTVREAARIQGFPDVFSFPADEDQAMRLIGNAVPPPAARALAAAIRSVFFSDHA